MRKVYLFLLCCCLSMAAFGTVVTVYSTGATTGYTSGSVIGTAGSASAGTLVRTANAITVECYRTGSASQIIDQGYTVFDLSSIPKGSTITSVTLGWYVSGYTAGSVAASCTWTVYGIQGDLSLANTAQSLNAAMRSNQLTGSANRLYSTTSTTGFGSGIGNFTGSLSTGFFTSAVGSKVSICFTEKSVTSTDTRIYTITGEGGNTTSTTTAGHAPYLTINYTAPSGCSGTPTAGTSSATPAAGNSTTSHLLSLSGATTAASLTYQWQSAPTASGTWTNISGATHANWTVNGSASTTYYRCLVTCSGSTGTSSVCSIAPIAASSCTPGYYYSYYASYVASTTYPNGGMVISPVIIGGDNSTSLRDSTIPPATGYSDHVNDPFTAGLVLYKGSTHSMTINSGQYSQNCQVWIDYNNDGAFATSESVGGMSSTTVGGQNVLTLASIPSTVTSGYYRLRIVSSYSSYNTYPFNFPCPNQLTGASFYYGETRDYLVNVSTPPPAMVASPTSLAFGATLSGGTSGTMTTALTGTFLTPASGTVVVTAPTNWQVFDGTSWVTSYSIAYSSSALSATVQARFQPPSIGSFSGNIAITGGGLSATYNIGVTGTGSAPCSGTPTAGTVACVPQFGNSSTTFVLTASGYTAAGAITFQWQSTPDTSVWSDISGATLNTYSFSGLTSTQYYRCVVTCGVSGLSAYTYSTYAWYLPPSGCTPAWYYASSVAGNGMTVATTTNHLRLNGLYSSSINDGLACNATAYADYNATQGLYLQAGSTYTMTVGNSGSYAMAYQVWIDFNNDGTFQTSESVGGKTSSAAAVQTFNIVLPSPSATIRPGIYRMRVEGEYNYHNYPSLNPCPDGTSTNSYYYGEVRDYSVAMVCNPTGYVTPTSIAFPPTVAGTTSSASSAAVTGYYLSPASGSLIVTAPTGFEVSYDGSTWSNSYSTSYTGAGTSNTIFIHFAPSASSSYSGNVTIAGGGMTTLNIAVTGTGAPACSGTPSAGTASASPTIGGASTTFTLTCAGYTSSGGVGFQWQSSTDSSSWSNVSGATSAIYSFSGVSASLYYRCVVTCSFSGLSANTYSTYIQYFPASSCTPAWYYASSVAGLGMTVATTTNHFIINGATTTLNDGNAVGATAYVDYTASGGSLTCDLNAGTTYTVTVGNSGSYTMAYQIWIDFNSDGIFQSTESVGGHVLTTAAVQTFTITLPSGSSSIVAGSYRMRVEGEYNYHTYPNLNPCPDGTTASSAYYGDVRDYKITFRVPPVASIGTASMAFPITVVGTSSASMTSSFSGSYLVPASGSLVVTAPANFKVSNDGSTWVNSYSISYSGSATSASTIYVQFNPTSATTYSGNVTITGGGYTAANIAVTGTGAPACSGTPAPGIATISPSAGGSTTVFTLTCSGYSTAGLITFQWQSSPDSTTWSNIGGATAATYGFTGITSATYYRCIVGCSVSGLSANTYATQASLYPASSCTPTWYYNGPSCSTYGMVVATTANHMILIGASGSINDGNACTGAGYTDYSSSSTLTCTVAAGATYTMTVGNSYGSTMSYQVWIDFNNNGTFETTESIGGIGSTSATVLSFPVTLPVGSAIVAPGQRRMRVVAEYYYHTYPAINPCPTGSTSLSYYYGEVRDYKITVSVPPAASVSPTSFSFPVTTTSTCSSPMTSSFSGSYLSPSSGSIVITAPTGYQVSPDGSSWASSYSISYSGASCSGTIYAQFCPSAASSYPGNITVAGGGFTTLNIAVTGTGSSSCTTTPTPGSASSSPTSGGSATTFTHSLTGTTSVGGLLYQWQSAPTAGGTWTDITGATNTTYATSGLTATTYYRCNVTCPFGGSSTNYSSIDSSRWVLTAAACTPNTGTGPYSAAAACATYYMRFDSVKLTGFSGSLYDNAACNSTGYMDRTSLAYPTIYKNTNYTITVGTGTSYQEYTQWWIDFNSDGTFQSSETVGGNTVATYGPTFGVTINVPPTAPTGIFRMRGVMDYSGDAHLYPGMDACMNGYNYGEARDYKISLINPPPTASATPTSLSFGTIATSSTSTAQSSALTAYFLTPASGSLTVTAPANYLVCNSAGGTYASSYTISYTGSTVSAATVYVKFVGPATPGTYSGNVTITGGGLSTYNIAVTGNSANPCVGTVAAGTTTASPATGSSATTFTIGLSGATIGYGISYQWQSSTTGSSGTFSDIPGATNVTYSVTGLTTATYYQCNVTCSFSGSTNTSAMIGVYIYCTPLWYYPTSVASYGMTVATTTNHLILTGSAGGINDGNACSATNPYSDYTAAGTGYTTTLAAGTTYTMTVGNSGSYQMAYQAWIDFNGDGVFQSTESVGGGTQVTSAVRTFNITIPSGTAGITPGSRRMRVEGEYYYHSFPTMNPCPDGTSANSFYYGEVRDYTVTITVPPTYTLSSAVDNFPATTVGTSSSAINTTFSGLYLVPASGSVVITAPTNFLVWNGSTWASSYSISYTGSTISGATISTQFNPTAVTTYTGVTTIVGGGISASIADTGTGAPTCSGTPTAGTATVTPNSGNATSSFTLTNTGFTALGGIQFQWQSSPDSTSWSNISGATLSSYSFTGITSNTYYRCVVTCSYSGVSVNTFATKASYYPASSCTPLWYYASASCSTYGMTVATAANHMILIGASGSINDGTACSGSGYSDLSSSTAGMTTTLNAGATYTQTVGNTYGSTMSYQTWIDFNNDGTFQTTERVGGLATTSGTVLSYNITLPGGSAVVTPGVYRMRVEAEYNYHTYPNLNPCPDGTTTNSYYYGEVRDYRVTVNVPPSYTLSATSCNFPPTTVGTSSSSIDRTFTGLYLVPTSGTIAITAPANFNVYDPGSSSWVSSYVINYTGATVPATTISTRFSPTSAITYTGVTTITGGGLSTINIADTGIGAPLCSGTPTAGTAAVSPTSGAAATTFTLTATGYTSLGGIQFQWQSSPDTTTWTPISGATLSTYSFSGLTTNTYYRCVVTCSTSSSSANTAAVLARYYPASSCTPTWYYGSSVCGLGMTVATTTNHMILIGASGSINDGNACAGVGYVDYSSSSTLTCTLAAGSTYTMTVGNSGTYTMAYQAWIDFNNDGIFQTTESIGGVTQATGAVRTFSCVIPSGSSSITPGIYRLRVEGEYNYHTYPNLTPCPDGTTTSSAYYGEVRDYKITLTVPPVYSLSPSSMLFPTTTVGSSSPTVNATLTASYMVPSSGSLVVTAPTNFKVWNASGSAWATSISIPYSGSALSATTVSFQFNPPSVGTFTGTSTIVGGGLSINIADTGIGAPTCSGTPTAGTASASPTSGSSVTTFTLSDAGYTSLGGIVFQWQSSTDSASWSPISGATLATYSFSGATTTKYYRCVVTCSVSGLSANTAGVKITIFPASSCTPMWYYATSVATNGMTVATTANHFILAGSSGSINDGNACSSTFPYSDYTSSTTLTCSMNAGGTYTATVGNSGSYSMSYQIWIDFNNDGTFQTTEKVGGRASTTAAVQTFSITLPAATSGVVPGVFRMRVEGEYNYHVYPNLNPCPDGTTANSFYYGEVRDYKVTINVPPTGTATPSSLAFSPTTVGFSSATQTSIVSALYLTPSSGNLTVSCPSPFQVYNTTTASWVSTYTIPYTGSTSSPDTLRVRFSPVSVGSYSGNISVLGGGMSSALYIAVTGNGTSACSGTPSAGSASATPTSGSSGTSFTLSLTGASVTGALTYQWQSCATSGGTYTPISGATNNTYTFSGLTANTYYNCVVTCSISGLSATSANTMLTWVLPSACTPAWYYAATACSTYPMNIAGFYINGLIGSISDATACTGTGYINQTGSMSTTLLRGATYTVTVNSGSATYSTNCQIWIDFNGDGTFQSTESVGGRNTLTGSGFTFTITIPSTAGVGTTRMRVEAEYNYHSYPSMNPCPDGTTASSFYYGEVRDYTAIVVAPVACSGTPSPGSVSASASSGCSPLSSTLSMPALAGVTGLTYQWQSSPTGTGSWTDITGATSATYASTSTATSATTPSYYQCVVTCTASGVTATSSPVTITVYPAPGSITGSTIACISASTTLSNSIAGGTWSSSSTSIATVNPSTGVVSGVTGGSCTISYTTTGCSPATASFTVNSGPASITGFASVCVGGTSTLHDATSGGTWSSSNTSIATVNSGTGVVTAVAAGTANIIYSNGCGTDATTSWTTNVTPSAIVGPASICTLSTGYFTDSVATGTWSTSSSTYGTIDPSSGLFTATSSIGTTTVTYTIGFCAATTTANVGATSPASISGTTTLCQGSSTTLFDATSGGAWTTSDPTVATIVGGTGVMTGVSSGTATIGYSTGCGTDATASVTVNGSAVTITSATVCSQGTLNMTANTGAGTYSYSWTGPNSFTSTVQSPAISNAATSRSGIYSVSATQAGCTSSTSYWVRVDTTVQVSVTASPSSICPGTTSNMSDAVTSPAIGSNNYEVLAIPYAPLTLSSVTNGPSGINQNATITLPFSFTFYGTSYSSVKISTNGYINFGAASTSYSVVTLPSSSAPLAMISPFWHYLNAGTGAIQYTTLGSAPNRKFVVRFNGVTDWVGSGINTGQVVLYETSNMIDMFISKANTASTYYGVCGIQNATGTIAATVPGQNNTNYVVNNTTSGTGWRFANPNYSYAWSPSTGLSSTTIANPVSSGLTTTQIYTVTTVDANNGCSTGNTSTATLNVYTLPAAFAMSPSTGCTAGTVITLAASETGVNYQLYNGASAVGSPIAGTGGLLTWSAVTTAGTYTIVGALATGGCTTTMTGSTIVYTSPTAFSITGGNGCTATGVTIGLSNSTSGVSYQLYNGSSTVGSAVSGTGSSITFGLQTAAGAYTITATGAGSCTTNMTGTVTITTSPQVHNLTGGNGCTSTGVTLGIDTTQSGVTYQLYRGASTVGSPASGTGSAISYGLLSTAGTYSVVATGTAGCTTNMTGTSVITTSPTAYSVTGGNGCTSSGVTIGVANSQSGVSYQLYNGGSTVGSAVSGTGSSISFGLQTAAGTYTVVGTGAASCATNMTGSVVISTSPVAFNVTGGGSYCGVVSLHVGIDSSESTATYQLYRGSSTVGSSVTGTGSSIDFGTFSTVGTYSVVATGAGSCTTNMTGSVVVADHTVSVVIGANPSVCQPISSASLAYSSAVGTPTLYNITWGSAASTAGFSDVVGGTLGSSIALSIPTGVHGVYTGTVSVSNGICVSADYSFTLTVYEHPNASITSAAVPCMGYATSVTFTGVSGATVSYNVDGGSPVTGTLTGGTYTFGTGALTSSHTYELLTAYNAVCSTTIDTTITINPTQMKWVGGASGAETDWNTDANWACGFVPGATDDAIIPAGTTYSPAITGSGTATTRNLTLEAGTTLNMNSGSTVNVKGTLQNDGSIKGSGLLSLNGTSAQLVKGLGTVSNLELNNTAGASMDTVSRMTIKNVLTITAGTFNSNDSLVIGSDSTATARVAPITTVGAGISGNVRVKQYMLGGRRAYRFMSHPFSSSIALRQWGTGIDVTGNGGATNGFTTTGSNAASAFWYHTAVGNSGLSYDPGWMAFTSANGTPDSNMVHRFQGIRIFCRGALGQGLSYATGYTPLPTTITTYGPLNQGSVTVPLVKGSGANEEYNFLGNPYASPVDLGTVAYNAKASGNIVGAGFYIWNPYAGTVGIFQAVPIGTTSALPYYLQANGAFEIRAAHNGDTLNFTENSKASTITTNLLKAAPEYVSLFIYDANYHPFDMLNVKFDDAATENEDNDYDATKPLGGDFNFYAISSDNKKMAIDGRPFVTDKVVPLGVTSNYTQEYIIKAEGVAVPEGGKVYLHDKMLKQYVLLQQGTEYRFTVTKDASSQGDNRFELSMNPSEVAALANVKGLEVTMTPNPANDDVKVAFTSGRTDKVSVRLLDLSGVSVYKTDLGTQQNGSVSISLGNLASGIYMVELTQGNQKVVQRLVKE